MTNSRRLQQSWPSALLFGLFAMALLYVQWRSNAHLPLHELGDHAANSMLVQDGKHLRLLYGNYSRIGTYHPGPALLYVLTAGEVLFYDWLHLTPTPLGGQLLGVCLYSAGWITLIFSLLRRMLPERLPALLFTLVFTGTLGYLTPSFFLGIWMPDMYILPFATMLVAISRLAYGHADSLRPLAIASGFTLNGHVSFIPMLGVVLIFMLAANWIISRRDRSQRILSPAYLLRHRRELLIASGILFLFLLPLLILTVTEFPGPLYAYAKFGGVDKHISTVDALKFVAFYWGGPIGWRWGILLLFVAVKGLRGPAASLVRDIRAIGIAMVAATLALFVYAKFGIDHPEMNYLGLFYYSVPALMAAVVVLYAYYALRSNAKVPLALLAIAGGIWVSWNAIREPVYYDDNYNIRGSAELYQTLRALPGEGRIVIDVDGTAGEWDKIWGNVIAIMVYAKREGDDLICVNQNWHLLFKRENRCRPDELNNPRHYFARYMRTADEQRGDADIEGQGMLLYRQGRVDTPGAYTKVISNPDYFRPILGKGWSNIEGDFVWSNGPVAEINLPANPARSGVVRLDLGYFRWERKSIQQLEVLVNGKSVGKWGFNPVEERRQIKVELGPEAGAAQHIELKIANPKSPLEQGLSADDRKLGVMLYGIRIDQR